jgi:hypothetical protein
MTPLAQMIVNRDMDLGGKPTVPELQTSDCHCFEVSEVLELIGDLIGNVHWRAREDPHLFLPSPITWIEHRTRNGRNGALLYQNPYGRIKINLGVGHEWIAQPIVARLLAYNSDDETLLWCQNLLFFGMSMANGRFYTGQHGLEDSGKFDDIELMGRSREIIASLALINTPRIIGRRQHMPHAGMQKKIAAGKKMVGKFPLKAWTEIKLEVTPPVIDGTPHETRLTGGKALHFCRAHLRIRMGRLERVSAHWRGDPSLGIKQTRYSVIPPRQHHRQLAKGQG